MSRSMLVAALLALAGCAIGPDYVEPETKVAPEFANAASVASTTTPVDVTWWRGFGDPLLEELIQRAAVTNLDLQVAAARIRESRALRQTAILNMAPIVPANADYTRSLLGGPTLPGFGYQAREREWYEASFDATWELDLYGRLRRALESNTALVGAAEASHRDVLVTLLAEVARNYLELRGTQNELAVALRNADNQRKTADLTISRLTGGKGTDFDVARAEGQFHSTKSTIPILEASIKRTIHRIGVLLGEDPNALVASLAPPRPLPEPPGIITLGHPEDLLRRRPDIRIAEQELHAATARIGVAKADLFPRLTFQGSVGLQVARLSKVGDAGQEMWSFGPQLSWAAFDLGRVFASIAAADEQAKAAAARFQQTVLLALEETESALVTYDSERARREELREATTQSEKAAKLARQRYDDGVTDFLTVLDADRRVLEAQDALAGSETRTATALVAIYKALGGGWEAFEPKSEDAK